MCKCNPGWKSSTTGNDCALLDIVPAVSKVEAAVYGLRVNVTSWGGNVLVDNTTGAFF